MSIQVFPDLKQGSEEWLAARCGLLTASTIGHMVGLRTLSALDFDCPECMAHRDTPCQSKPTKDGEARDLKNPHPARAEHARNQNVQVLAVSYGDTAKSLADALIAERITGHVEDTPMSRPMQRGIMDEPYARAAYAEQHAPVTEVGFIVSDDTGYRVGYSPDGLVGDDGLIEIKSRNQRIQLRTHLGGGVPTENVAQLQFGLFVTGRKWIDYVSYCGGMPLHVERVFPDHAWHQIFGEVIPAFEAKATETISRYLKAVEGKPMTERIDHFGDKEIQ